MHQDQTDQLVQALDRIHHQLHEMRLQRVKGLSRLEQLARQIQRLLNAQARCDAHRIDTEARLLALENAIDVVEA